MPTPTTTTYDPDSIHVTFAGHFIQGFGDGTFVAITKTAPVFSTKVGVKGDVTRTRSHNKSGTVTFTIMQTSESNDRLSQIHRNDLILPNGGGIGSLTIQDINGTSLYTSNHAWIESAPDASFEAEAGTRDWVIAFASIEENHGSNPSR